MSDRLPSWGLSSPSKAEASENLGSPVLNLGSSTGVLPWSSVSGTEWSDEDLPNASITVVITYSQRLREGQRSNLKLEGLLGTL
jgi:hypothetical protein